MKHLTLLICAVLPLAACTKTDDPKTPPANTGTNTGAGAATDDHGHGPRKPLGAMTIGAHTFDVVQLGDVAAGKQAVVELEFAAGKPLPATARGWIGAESGQGSVKAPFDKEGEHGMHAHLEVPKTLPAGSALWIELEDGGKTEAKSVAWK